MILPNLALKAKIGYKFFHNKKSLLSILAIYDEGSLAIFNNNNVLILFQNKIIIQGIRDKTTGL